jgi:uncharacterized protein YdeI (YjbR/CyaY-like superfamily)
MIEMDAILKAYIFEAKEVEKASLKVELKKPSQFIVATAFQSKINTLPKKRKRLNRGWKNTCDLFSKEKD